MKTMKTIYIPNHQVINHKKYSTINQDIIFINHYFKKNELFLYDKIKPAKRINEKI